MTRTILDSVEAQVKEIEDFKNASVEKQRFLVYTNKIGSNHQIVRYETDDKLCYFVESLTPRMGTKGFVQRKAGAGITFDKKTKKLKIWYGTKMSKMPQHLKDLIFKDLKMEWVNAMDSKLKQLMTRMLLEKIIKGKITNPRDYVKSYVKCHLRVKGVSPEHYYKLFKDDGSITLNGAEKTNPYARGILERDLSPGQLNEILRHSKNPDWVVENYYKADIFSSYLYVDIVKECKILGRKFDWSWSKKRIEEEHKLMSREIRGLELEFIDDTVVEYKNVPQLPEGWELINSRKRLFVEGSDQDHCVYNYWSELEDKSYFVLSIKDGEDRITASIHKSYAGSAWRRAAVVVDHNGVPKETHEWEISQIYGKRNTPCPQKIKDKVEEWLSDKKIQRFFENQKEKVGMVVTKKMQEDMAQPGWVI